MAFSGAARVALLASLGPVAVGASMAAASPPAADRQAQAEATGSPSVGEQPLQLLQAHVFFRHGDRTPMNLGIASEEEKKMWEAKIQPYPARVPKLPHTSGIDYPFGQLTTKGASQAEGLGERLKLRYSHLLTEKQWTVRSTDFPRTFLSGYFVLKGLLGSEEAWKVPIHIRDEKLENLYGNDHCARGNRLWKHAWRQVRDNGDGAAWRARHESMKKPMADFFGLSLEQRFPWTLAIDNIVCRLSHGLPVPEGLSANALAEIQTNLARDYGAAFASQECAQLAMGRLINDVLTSMKNSVVGNEEVGLALYSGHDSTLLPLAAALGCPLDTWPSYSSYLSVELWRTADSALHFVRALYDGRAVTLPARSPPPGGSWGLAEAGAGPALCAWEDFLRLAAWAALPEAEYARLCRQPPPHSRL